MADNFSDKSPTNKRANTFLKIVIACSGILLLCVLLIAFTKKHSTHIHDNTGINEKDLAEFQIFDGIKIKLPKHDSFAYDAVKHIDQNLVAFLKKNVHKGDTIVEVSNSIGHYTMLLAKLVDMPGRVYTFNAYLKYAESIKNTAKANDFQNRIFIDNKAISSNCYNGMLVHKNNFSPFDCVIMDEKTPVRPGFTATKVKVSSIDEQLPNLQHINFLVISYHSKACDVLLGAKHIIEKSPNVYVVLHCDVLNSENKKTIETFLSNHHSLYSITASGELKKITLSELDSKNNMCCFVLKRN